jgi:5-methylcytosine-specific restriction protein B
VRDDYLAWMKSQRFAHNTLGTRRSDARRVEQHYGDLDEAYDRDRFASILEKLRYSAADSRAGRSNPSSLPIEGDLNKCLASYRSALSAYARFRQSVDEGAQSGGGLDRAVLEELKRRFLRRFPDFAERGFAASEGGYWDEERHYKQRLLDRATEVLARNDLTPYDIARGLIEIVTSRESNLLDWRILGRMRAFQERDQGLLVEGLGEMLVSEDDPASAVEEHFTDKVAQEYLEGHEGNLPFADLRAIPTVILALARPEEAIAVRYQPIHTAGMRLLHRPLLGNGPLTADEYCAVLDMAESIAGIMRDEWGWEPRDLWDVQGFIWTTCTGDKEMAVEPTGRDPGAATAAPQPPTNLILYGPPGTGKTFATTFQAVRICDGDASPDRAALMERYRELVERKRIAFVTFHQSYAYEDFVEGLRPETGESEGEDSPDLAGQAGFNLKPRSGVFRSIAELARDNKGPPQQTHALDRGRKVFKMSLGRSWNEEGARLFREALDGGFVVLGYGGDVDWSPPQYDDFQAIKARWRQDNPDATGNDPNIVQIFTLRANMEIGSLIIVSDGNRRFRAIGEVTGPYYYEVGELREHNHRRPVRWLWHSHEGLPRELIYGRSFSQVSAYQLYSEQINWPALEQIIAGAAEGRADGPPEAYVLIIDEINRANISKVFGELITLIEPDKRLGNVNELTVTLPYSGETFGVPANLHIIGTMNTADRSIALLDTALRRRFRFRELMPDPVVLAEASRASGIDLGAMLTRINQRIEYLFDREHQIGHAYFIGCQSRDDVDEVMRHQVLPLLAEYFYEDWEKVAQVVGDGGAEVGAFVRREKLPAPDGGDSAEARWRWSVASEFAKDAYARLAG